MAAKPDARGGNWWSARASCPWAFRQSRHSSLDLAHGGTAHGSYQVDDPSYYTHASD
jgi:hypothetical protein